MDEALDAKKGYLAGLGAYFVWGLLPLYWKLIEAPAFQITIWRMVQAAVLMTALVWWRQHTSPRDLFADKRASAIHFGTALLLFVNWFVYVYAVNSDRVVESSLGYFINPLVSVALGLVFLGERLRRAQQLAVAVALVGVAILTIEAGSLPWISLALAFTFGLYGLIRKLSPRNSFEGLTQEMLWMLPFSAGALLWLGRRGELVGGDTASTVAMCFLGLLTALPLVMFATAARNLPLSVVGMMQYLAPTMQFLLGVFVFGEIVSGGRWLGSAVIWVALAILASDSARSYSRQR